MPRNLESALAAMAKVYLEKCYYCITVIIVLFLVNIKIINDTSL